MQQSSKLEEHQITYNSIAQKIATSERDMNKLRLTYCSVVAAGATVLLAMLAAICC